MKRLGGILLALALSAPVCAYGSEAEIQELNERVAVLEYRIETLEKMLLGSPAGAEGMGQNNGAASGEEAGIEIQEADIQAIGTWLNKKLTSEEFLAWQELYQVFTGEEPGIPEVIHAMRYQIEDFDGVEVDCFLVNVAADVAYWVNEEAQQGAADESFQFLIDVKTMKNYDNITTEAGNVQPDTATELGRAQYLLGIYRNWLDGFYEGFFVNDREMMAELTADELAMLNSCLE